ncbi:MAG: ABC transporter permease [Alphaproteobacteria bacterium]|nr:ABC transporter permease [Alphaproteobacteria bacterium]
MSATSTTPPAAVPQRHPRIARRWRIRLRRAGTITASFALGLVVWEAMSLLLFGPFLIPPPQAVLRAFVPMSASGELLHDVTMSLSRVFVGYVTGGLFALVVGLLMGRIRLLHDLADPVLQFLRFLSPTAMIPIVVIWFGIGEVAKYSLVFWGTLFSVLISTIAGVLRTPHIRQNAALCLGASEAQIFRLIVLPSAVPYIVVGLRLALASAFISIIPAELLAADSGLGYLLQQSSMLQQTDRIFVALVMICTIGFVADRLFQLATATLLRRYLAVT